MGDSAASETRELIGNVPGLYLLACQDIFDMIEEVITKCIELAYKPFFIASFQESDLLDFLL